MKVRAQIRIPYFTTLPRDQMTNTWHFQSSETTLPDANNAIAAALQAFYNTVYGTTGMAAINYDWGNAECWAYDMDDPPPRIPDIVSMPISDSPIANTLPPEVAVVMSFQATPSSGIPQARRRGRVYLGGLGNAAAAASASSSVFVNSGFRTPVASAATTLLGVGATAAWNVYSPTQEAANPGTGWAPVDNGWINNEFDSQRRRGVIETGRTTF